MSKETKAVWLYRLGVCIQVVADVMLWPGLVVDDLGRKAKNRAVFIATGMWP